MEAWLGRTISEDDLDRGIDIVNTNRRLLRGLYELRKADPPLISGAEAATLVVASQITDKREINPMLAQILQSLPERRDGSGPGPRIMMIGSENHDLELLRLIESCGATIVIEEQCTGSRYFWNQVIPEGDRISAIAQRYISRPRCPLKDINERQRLDHVMDLAREFNVQGALLVHQKFCAPHEFDLPHIDELLKGEGIPTYVLELDVTMHKGSVTTRTEAFLEMLELDLV
jgi:benzoyl-CoA reductase subunit C